MRKPRKFEVLPLAFKVDEQLKLLGSRVPMIYRGKQ